VESACRPASWQRPPAVVSSLLSLPAAILYYAPNINLTGALAVDLGGLYCLLLARRPKPE
jgi:hypothetical protein